MLVVRTHGEARLKAACSVFTLQALRIRGQSKSRSISAQERYAFATLYGQGDRAVQDGHERARSGAGATLRGLVFAALRLVTEAAGHCLSCVSVACVSVGLESGPQAPMPKDSLHTNRRRAIGEHFGCCGVTQHVRCHVTDPAATSVELH